MAAVTAQSPCAATLGVSNWALLALPGERVSSARAKAACISWWTSCMQWISEKRRFCLQHLIALHAKRSFGFLVYQGKILSLKTGFLKIENYR
jgi:hypothetical protein